MGWEGAVEIGHRTAGQLFVDVREPPTLTEPLCFFEGLSSSDTMDGNFLELRVVFKRFRTSGHVRLTCRSKRAFAHG